MVEGRCAPSFPFIRAINCLSDNRQLQSLSLRSTLLSLWQCFAESADMMESPKSIVRRLMGQALGVGIAWLAAAYYHFGPPQNDEAVLPWVITGMLMLVLMIKTIEQELPANQDVTTRAAKTLRALNRTWVALNGGFRQDVVTSRAKPAMLIHRGLMAFLLYGPLGFVTGALVGWACLKLHLLGEGMDATEFNSVVIKCGVVTALVPILYYVLVAGRTFYVLSEVGGDHRAVFRLLGLVTVVVVFYTVVYFIISMVSPESFNGIRSDDAPGLLEDLARMVANASGETEQGPIPKLIDCFYFSLITIGTVGYGDIHPVSGIAKLVVCSEVVSGYFFLVIAISSALNRAPRRMTSGNERQ